MTAIKAYQFFLLPQTLHSNVEILTCSQENSKVGETVECRHKDSDMIHVLKHMLPQHLGSKVPVKQYMTFLRWWNVLLHTHTVPRRTTVLSLWQLSVSCTIYQHHRWWVLWRVKHDRESSCYSAKSFSVDLWGFQFGLTLLKPS